jgi:hypothetical protein
MDSIKKLQNDIKIIKEKNHQQSLTINKLLIQKQHYFNSIHDCKTLFNNLQKKYKEILLYKIE